MIVGIIGSRNITNFSDLSKHIPIGTSKIISGGATGVDLLAKEYALTNNISFLEFLPEYEKYAKIAPLKRNDAIINHCDFILAVWDGKSKGTKYVIDKCIKLSKPFQIILT